MKPQITVLICLAMVVSAANAADAASLSSAYSRCLEKAGAIDPAVTECMAAENALQDKRLNKAYKVLMGKLDSERQKQLHEAQCL